MLDPYKETIEKWHNEDLSRRRICEKLRDEYQVHSSYINVCKYIQKHFPKPIEAFGVQVTQPGEVAEIDFGELGRFPSPAGTLIRTFGLVVVLPYSRQAYYAITYDQKLETLCQELEKAFTFFGGVPEKIKVDNMRTAILKNQHYDVILNPDFLEFTNHYKTIIIPCEPYSPEQKGTVESGVKYLQGNFIAGRTFRDAADIRQQLKDWTINYANVRIHGTTKKIPFEVFQQEERAKLQPLPETPFAFFNRGVRKVAPNCHINFANNYYSVPFALVGKEVTVRWNKSLLRIVYQGEEVALHTIMADVGNYETKRNHLPDFKTYSENERQIKYETKLREIGTDAHEYFRWLLVRKERYWFIIVRGILGLAKHYDKEAVNKALKRAMFYQVTEVVTIRRILEKKLYLLELEPKLLDAEKIIFLPEENTLCRDLLYYSG